MRGGRGRGRERGYEYGGRRVGGRGVERKREREWGSRGRRRWAKE